MAKHKSPHPVGPYLAVDWLKLVGVRRINSGYFLVWTRKYPLFIRLTPTNFNQSTASLLIHIMPHRYLELPNIKWIISVMFLSTTNRGVDNATVPRPSFGSTTGNK